MPGDTSSPLGKIVLLTSLAAGVIAIYEWLANDECPNSTSDLYGSSICSWLGLGPTAAQLAAASAAAAAATSPSTTSTPATSSNTPTAAQLATWMQNSIGSQNATVSQWNWAMAALINGTNGTTGQPNPGPFVGPGVNLPGFTSAGQLTTASGYLAALQAYQEQGNTVPGLSGANWAGFGAYWVPGMAVHSAGAWNG